MAIADHRPDCACFRNVPDFAEEGITERCMKTVDLIEEVMFRREPFSPDPRIWGPCNKARNYALGLMLAYLAMDCADIDHPDLDKDGNGSHHPDFEKLTIEAIDKLATIARDYIASSPHREHAGDARH